MTSSHAPRLAVAAVSSQWQVRAAELAVQYGLPLAAPEGQAEDAELLLWVGARGIGLGDPSQPAMQPVYVDFTQGALGYRAAHSNLGNEHIARAVGLKKGLKKGLKNNQALSLIDTTAGLGRDAFILATLGCQVTMLERNPIVALMLADGLERAASDSPCQGALTRLRLLREDAQSYLDRIEQRPDVIYLDPMFPSRSKSASVKKELRILQLLIGSDLDAAAMHRVALQRARKRVVVKRPKLAPPLGDLPPDLVIKGNAGRFDIYLLAGT